MPSAQALMPYEVGRDALDFLVRHSGTRRNLEVDFFGGEPDELGCSQALSGLRARTGKAAQQGVPFTLTTNGVLLDDEVMDFCNREMHNVVLSLDGRREVHDRFRVDRQGRGSYEAIVPKFQEFVRRRGHQGYYMRGTFTHYNLDFLNDILHMADLGFTQLSMEPVVTSPDNPSAITQDDLPQVFEQYERLAQVMLERHREGRPFDFYHFLIDLGHGPCIHKRIIGCGSGTEYLAVTPWGDLYPCHQFVGEQQYRLGSLSEGITNATLQQEFGRCNVFPHRVPAVLGKYFAPAGVRPTLRTPQATSQVYMTSAARFLKTHGMRHHACRPRWMNTKKMQDECEIPANFQNNLR